MKLALLGTGMIVQDLLTTYEKLGIEKTYIFSTERSKAKAEDLVAKYHLDGVYTDYATLLDTDIDTVYVGLPNSLHFKFAKQALEAGKHVIMEKPITANAIELKELMEIAVKNHCILLEAMTVHSLPAYLELKKDLHQIGKIRVACFNFSQYSSRYDAFREGEVKPAFDPKMAGGALMDLNVYNLHAAIGLFGVPKAVSYAANVQKGIDTSGVATLQYDDLQCVCIGAKDCSAPIVSTLQGEDGTIVIRKQVSLFSEYEIHHKDGTVEMRSFHQEEHRMYYEFMEFQRMIDCRDEKEAERRIQLSYEISKCMEDMRRKCGITFPSDTK